MKHKYSKTQARYYLAYGSNLNVAQMSYRCPGATIFGTATIPNYALLFRGSKTGSYLTIEPEEGNEVPVAVWAVTEQHEESLDRYEGFPTFYYKAVVVNLPIRTKDGRVVKRDAFVYIMHRDRPVGIPSHRYVETCQDGYNDFGFDPAYLYDAITRSVARATEVRKDA